MSVIDKLAITGIRSFSNTHSETIQFYTPLTLVVGYNGSGKTTIIECLKYATTGQLPPNSKGGAFIHDPNLAGEKEVLAQVKISFESTSKARMVATRSLQLTVKKLTRSQKTLEGSLLMKKEGERTVISSRVAELDQILPQYLGTSTAILENVIFCHQEDSLWPMSGPLELKKKFDEIFEAQKYTKAIDNIKKLRKTQNEELAKYKIIEANAKVDKDRSIRSQKRSVELSNEIEALREQCEKHANEMKHAKELADQAWSRSENYAKILGALEGKKVQAESTGNIIRKLKARLKEVPESDEWIEAMLAEFDSRMEAYEEQEKSKTVEYHERKESLEESRRRLGKRQADHGKYEQDKDEYDRQVARRRTVVKEVASKHNVRGFDDISDESNVNDFLLKIRRLKKEQNSAFDKARRQANADKSEAQTLVNKLMRRKEALQADKTSARGQMTQNDREAGEHQKKISQITVDEGSKAVIESRIEDTREKLTTVKKHAEDADWDVQIRVSKQEQATAEEKLADLDRELLEVTKKAGEVAKLAHLRQELKDRQKSIQIMTSAHGNRITKLLNREWTPSTVQLLYDEALSDRSKDLASAERERDIINRELERVSDKHTQIRDDLKAKEKECKICDIAIREALEDEEPSRFPELLRQEEERLEAATTQYEGTGGLAGYFDDCVKKLSPDDPKCRTCNRPFHNKHEIADFKKRIKELLNMVQGQQDEEEYQAAKETVQILKDVELQYNIWKRLREDDIPDLTREEQKLSGSKAQLGSRLEERDNIVERRKTDKADLELVSRNLQSIGKCSEEIANFEGQISDISSKQSKIGATRTLDEVQVQVGEHKEKARESRKAMDRLVKARDDSRSELSDLELQLRDFKSELQTVGFRLETKATHLARIEEFKQKNEKQREIVNQADQDIENIEPEIATAVAKQQDVIDRAERREVELQEGINELSESVNSLDLLTNQINSYIERGGPEQIPRILRDIKTSSQEINQLENEMSNIAADINKIKSQLQDSDNTRGQYSDNLQYRQESRALESLRAEIKDLESQNAAVDRARFQQESDKRSKEHQRLIVIHAGKAGEMKQKDKQLEELIKEYKTDLQDAPQRYKEAHIKVETTKAAVEDLGRYGGALDKAIMKYHSLKMSEINRIAAELWQQAYKGSDVDSICIRGEQETTKGNRTYNYRVTMIKAGVEMDMRGRCSAGQKMLASIIIRLALAECFGINCGCIALDEPTTNLDRENIEALAKALKEIIESRQNQQNFQLIIITHDEDFLRHMQCGSFADYYWRVSRDPQQKSIIERQSIADVAQ